MESSESEAGDASADAAPSASSLKSLFDGSCLRFRV